MEPNRTARYLFSLEYILALNIFYFIFYAIDAGALFYKILPDTVSGVLRYSASACIGIVVGAALLTATIYSENSRDNVMRYTFFSMSLFLMMSFFGVFDDIADMDFGSMFFTKTIICIFLSVIEMNNARLLLMKFQELKRKSSKRNQSKVPARDTKKFQCRHCGQQLNSESTWKKHEAKCNHNPKNKMK